MRGERMEQQEIIEERRDRYEIGKDLGNIKYAIKKETQSFKQEEKKIDQLETSDMDKRAKKARLIVNHITIMRKLHEQQTAIDDEFLKYKLMK
jgi:hypothetical protein